MEQSYLSVALTALDVTYKLVIIYTFLQTFF